MNPHHFPTGTVYGVLLNFHAEMDAMRSQMHEAPYKAPPAAPVLYIKPANTWNLHGGIISLPATVPEVEVGATIAMVIGPASGNAAGFRLMNDLSIPHASFFRPPVKFKCLDGFLGIGDSVVPSVDVGDPSTFTLQVHVNGELRQSVAFSNLVRDAHRLLADVSAFMTVHAGDVLMLGCDAGRPLARVGDRIDITSPGLGTLTHTVVAEVAP